MISNVLNLQSKILPTILYSFKGNGTLIKYLWSFFSHDVYGTEHILNTYQMSIRSRSIVNKYGYNWTQCFTLLYLVKARTLNEPNVRDWIIGVSDEEQVWRANSKCHFNITVVQLYIKLESNRLQFVILWDRVFIA